MVIGRIISLVADWLPGPFGCSFWPLPLLGTGHKVHTHWLHFKFKAVRDGFEKHFVDGIERAAELSERVGHGPTAPNRTLTLTPSTLLQRSRDTRN